MSVAENIRKSRVNVGVIYRWSKEEVSLLLHKVQITGGDLFEKPTAQLYYKKLADAEPIFQKFSWSNMRDKMRYLKAKFKAANDWRGNTGAGLDGPDKEKSIREYLLKLCPEFDQLNEIFGAKPSYNPIYQFDSAPLSDTREVDKFSYFVDCKDQIEELVIENTPVDEDEGGSSQVDSLESARSQLSKSSAKRRKNNSALAELAEANKHRIDQLREANQLEQEKFMWQKLCEEKRVELELEKMKAEEYRHREELRLKELDIANRFALEKQKLEAEVELKKYELELKYGVNSKE